MSAGYCDLNFPGGRLTPLRWGSRLVEDGVDGGRELLTDGRRGIEPGPLCIDGLDGVRVDGKDEREAWRLRKVFVPPVVPLVEGR